MSDTKCGLCSTPKHPVTYAHRTKQAGVVTRTVLLCERCDRTPQPPIRMSHDR